MTILAGLWHAGRLPVPEPYKVALRSALSRDPGDARWQFERPGAFLAKVDLEVYGSAAVVATEHATTMVSGEPLLMPPNGVAWRPRSVDSIAIHDALLKQHYTMLAGANGGFAAATYHVPSHRLVLATDPLGLRALYVAQLGEWVVYSTALRVLLALPGIRATIDPLGATEHLLLQAPLEGRTRYREVRLLGAAELNIFAPERPMQVERLVQWDDVAPVTLDSFETLELIGSGLRRAIAQRLQGDRTVNALLSGGLDSRMTVALLLDMGVTVRSFNFSLEGSLDQVLGAQYAEAAGLRHTSAPYQAGLQDSYDVMLAAELARQDPVLRPERPGLIWSSFGGSAILGQNYNSPTYVSLLRAGRDHEALAALRATKRQYVPRRLFRSGCGPRLDDSLTSAMVRELQRQHPADPGRKIELSILVNSTRCQLHPLQEDADRLRLEHQSPMLDTAWMRSMLALPLDNLLGHRLYHRWVQHVGGVAAAVPWQAYPGHEPCPLPMPAGFRPQWQISADASFRRKAVLRHVRRLVGGALPSELISRRFLIAAALLHGLALRNYAYAIRFATRLTEWWHDAGRHPVDTERLGPM